MKNSIDTVTLALMAATLTLTAAACTEDGPVNITEAESETPEAFDPETVYAPAVVGGSPLSIEEAGAFFQFDSEEAKRAFVKGWTPPMQVVPLSADRAVQFWDKKKTVVVVTTAADGGWRAIHIHNPPPNPYGPDRERRREVRR